MFPTPLESRGTSARVRYQLMLPIALILWLLPLIAIFLTFKLLKNHRPYSNHLNHTVVFSRICPIGL